jgi:pimeloyl-ACP methyl ester carboxylesterase
MSGLPDVAKGFQEAGITALIYDPRSTGLSEGSPRNDIDPIKQTEDFSDALTFMCRLPTVDPEKLGIWGISFAGGVALSVASLDKRVKMVIAVCPAGEYRYATNKVPKVLAKCIQDRQSQMKGNPPYSIPMINAAGKNSAGFNIGTINADAMNEMRRKLKDEEEAHYSNRTTIQTYYKLIMWQPSPIWKLMDHTPVLFVVPELDTMCPPEVQRRYFDNLSEPKRWHVVKGKGHMDVTTGSELADLMQVQIEFVLEAFRSKVA